MTPISLATLALLGTDGRAFTLAEAKAAIDPVREYVDRDAGCRAARISTTDDRRTLDTLVEHGVVERFDGGAEPVYRIRADRDLEAAFYRNVIIHWFVNRAIAELALRRGDDREDALQQAFRLRDLLKFEFFFARKRGVPRRAARGAGAAGRPARRCRADRVLRSFLEAYWVVADRLCAHGDAPVDPTRSSRSASASAASTTSRAGSRAPRRSQPSCSRPALKLAANRGLVDNGDGRAAFKARARGHAAPPDDRAARHRRGAAPRGRRTAAFFDFDGTMIDGYSAMAMMQHRWRRREMSPLEIARLLMVGVEAGLGRADFERFMRVGVRAFRGRQVDDMAEFGEKLMRSRARRRRSTPRRGSWSPRTARKGHTVVVATSALPFQVEPLAREFGVDHVLCTRLEERDGVLTGEVDGPILWGPGKAARGQGRSPKSETIDLEQELRLRQRHRGHRVPRDGRPPDRAQPDQGAGRGSPTSAAGPPPASGRAGGPASRRSCRTVAAYGGLTAGLYAGVGLGLLKRSRKAGMNTTMSLGSDVGARARRRRSSTSSGEEHLWSHRPAVFIFNHQSWLDGMIVMKLLREDVTAVAKKEVARSRSWARSRG